MSLQTLRTAVARGSLRPFDLQFAQQLTRIWENDEPDSDPNPNPASNPLVLLAAALASHRAGQGDVCLSLPDHAGQPIGGGTVGSDVGVNGIPAGDHHDEHHGGLNSGAVGRANGRGGDEGLAAPPLEEWLACLRAAPLIGRPGERKPLILDDAGRLYLARFWYLEEQLADALRARLGQWREDVDHGRLRAGLERLFPPPAAGQIDWQRVAAALAVLRPVCVISGGPGTGKTRTVASVLALLQEQAGTLPLRIGLAAPTGKAAARLSESIAAQKGELDIAPEIRAAIPEDALTLHRLLGYRPGRASPQRGPDNPLHLDVLVVDEASMVDLSLMSRTLAALAPDARLILLGDRNQLSSVAAGMVLGDICGRGASLSYSPAQLEVLAELGCAIPESDPMRQAPERQGGLADHIVELRKSWRFDDASGIGALATAVNAGDGARAAAVLQDPAFPDVVRLDRGSEPLKRMMREQLAPIFREAIAAADPTKALQELNRFRILTAVREGPHGVNRLNTLAADVLESAGAIARSGSFYPGLPLMITANDHAQRLYNGDVGIILPDADADGALRFWLQTSEGVRRLLPARLPAHETVFAMTIHKSQGSEFDNVLLVLPETDSPLLTRELLYTGITRAKKQAAIMAEPSEITSACTRRVERATGLFDALWQQ
ncbi:MULTISPECIES: exodeoxyribonuclease V subunit alpha [Thiorhodovibrio]|uniref:exodeoxyribonuclease V subunit alpha n=1 Tax=Thiorhodovibrio TaxID=61593 RepID=UPI0019115974|nr:MULTISPECIES: exodeoxyribonuclease V subunit alpha [Thiorhodovibrio]MBK5968551.1 exodeoxyribonuclease V subunit alpha [Thiorhodovibrio winogradskyi]WPL11352.1 Exodeoxyribonuclease V alpha chain [Thiorhodovibrio litoralis]